MADYKLLTFLIIMLSINVVTSLYTSALVEINPSLQPYSNAMAQTPFGQMGDHYSVNESFYTITTTDSVDTTTGSVYTDNFKTMQQFMMQQDEKTGIIKGLFTQPGGMMKIMGVPDPIVTGFMFIWYVIAALLFAAFLTGSGGN